MRIDDLNRAGQTQGAEKLDQFQTKAAGDRQGGISGTDRADVSQLAQALSAGGPSRVEQLRLAVQSGKYDVPADVVASAIIQAHSRE